MARLDLPEFLNQLDEHFDAGELVSVSISGRHERSSNPSSRYDVRPVVIRDMVQLQWTCRDESRRQTHENLSWDETRDRFAELFPTDFRNALVRLQTEDLQLQQTKKGQLQLHRHASARKAAVPLQHDASRQYIFPPGKPVPFLVELGIMSAQGNVRKPMYRKFRQINRFAEFILDLDDRFTRERPLRIVDYGCGKSYLTFAIREVLVNHLGRSVEIHAFDRNPEVIQTCEEIRSKIGVDDIRFETADIGEAMIDAPLDLAIWLHACDTATDDALAKSIELQAEVILAVPCCQHELHHQLDSEDFAPVLKHGILRERLAALTTDALRAQYLEMCGYRTQVIEFIDLEHTAKNLLIRAVRGDQSDSQEQAAREGFERLKQSLGVDRFHLETVQANRSTNGSP
ncbi:class I SAM-dependent methyltransferase [Rubinisphaera margarita]|uniref:class I SAM-dependent methyltransferase n=1 Tax=Rubinisphaera margarita TaxID=2909586 RepID=UPI001EE847B8|nr:SAM-dependent methyltransferase [Rubinisphaera margarita]MCG6155097.1 SAM-dependent methyltransferase [Rubinisphaera margarita]